MSDLVERQFPAKALMTGLRAIGYSFSSAVADIIDNSISANASEINISLIPYPILTFAFWTMAAECPQKNSTMQCFQVLTVLEKLNVSKN